MFFIFNLPSLAIEITSNIGQFWFTYTHGFVRRNDKALLANVIFISKQSNNCCETRIWFFVEGVPVATSAEFIKNRIATEFVLIFFLFLVIISIEDIVNRLDMIQ